MLCGVYCLCCAACLFELTIKCVQLLAWDDLELLQLLACRFDIEMAYKANNINLNRTEQLEMRNGKAWNRNTVSNKDNVIPATNLQQHGFTQPLALMKILEDNTRDGYWQRWFIHGAKPMNLDYGKHNIFNLYNRNGWSIHLR